jgi:predicted NUDIX family NTP pyrophosphohydrolase
LTTRNKASAGLLLYRRAADGIEVLLAHPGGPMWSKRDLGAWTVPKGEIESGEEPLAVARREFREEIGHDAPGGMCIDLGVVRQKSGKVVTAWACEGDLDPATAVSNTFAFEWPPGSGRFRDVPEVDRVGWFAPAEAREKLNPAQAAFVDRLLDALGLGATP